MYCHKNKFADLFATCPRFNIITTCQLLEDNKSKEKNIGDKHFDYKNSVNTKDLFFHQYKSDRLYLD